MGRQTVFLFVLEIIVQETLKFLSIPKNRPKISYSYTVTHRLSTIKCVFIIQSISVALFSRG